MHSIPDCLLVKGQDAYGKIDESLSIDAGGAIAWTKDTAMQDAAWELLDVEGAVDEYTKDAKKSEESWFKNFEAKLREKKIKRDRLTCEFQRVDRTLPDGRKCKGWAAVLKGTSQASRPWVVLTDHVYSRWR